MKLKTALRGLLLDWLADRDDRYYWRQPNGPFTPPQGAAVLVWQPDGKLGDSVLHTTLVFSLSSQRPDLRLVVVCAPSLQSFWERIPGVHAVIGATAGRGTAQAVLKAVGHVDVMVSTEAFLSLDTVRFMRSLKPRVSIGLNVGRYKLFSYSIADHSYDHPRRHVTDRLRAVCELLSLTYQTDSALKDVATSGLTPRVTLAAGVPHVFLNTFGAGSHRTFNSDTVDWLTAQVQAMKPGVQIIFNVPGPERDVFAQRHGLDEASQLMLAPPNMDLWELTALIAQCQAVVTPDTSIGHIAAALAIPSTVLFHDSHYTTIVWAPTSPLAQLVKPLSDGDVNNLNHFHAQAALQQALCAQVA
jgi:ADP-heptose:LPS heptosyltransferase